MNDKDKFYAVNSLRWSVSFCGTAMTFVFRQTHAIQLESHSPVQRMKECPAPRLESG